MPPRWESLQRCLTAWCRLVTSGFMHFGIIRLAFSMFLSYQLAHVLEPALGRVRFTLVYFAGLFGGSLGICCCSPAACTAGRPRGVHLALSRARRQRINPLSTSIGTLL